MARVLLAEMFFVVLFGDFSKFLLGGYSFAVQAVLGDEHQLYLLDSLLRKRHANVSCLPPSDFWQLILPRCERSLIQ